QFPIREVPLFLRSTKSPTTSSIRAASSTFSMVSFLIMPGTNIAILGLNSLTHGPLKVNSAHPTCPAGKSWCAEIQVTGGRTCTDFPNAVWSTFPPPPGSSWHRQGHISVGGHHEHPLN